MSLSDGEVMAALAGAAEPGQQGWRFPGSREWHSTEQAKVITRFCLILGQPVSDILSSDLFAAVVDRLVALEDRLS